MAIDYQALCKQLFGTDDVKELTAISEKLNAKNPRNAGRKRRFTEEDIEKMREMQHSGTTINEIARIYSTSRQMISKSLRREKSDSASLRITYMWKQNPCTIIDVDLTHQKVFIDNKTDDLMHRAFGIVEEPTWNDFQNFLEDRCFPVSRGDGKFILDAIGVKRYNLLQILRKTKGKMAEDNMWMKFQDYEEASNGED